MEQLDQMILLHAAEEAVRKTVTPAPEILEGSPQFIKTGHQKIVQYNPGDKEPEVEETKDDEVRDHPDIIQLGKASTQWFKLPEEMKDQIKLVQKGAVALAQSLNQIREYMEYHNARKLKTARTLCEMEFGKDTRYPPRIPDQPDDEDVRLVIRHALRPR